MTDAGQPRRPHVLVVDDDANNRSVFTRMLILLGYDVTAVDDGWAAVRAAESGRIDVILMDGRMPGLDGYQASRRIREAEKHNHVPIIAVTASVLESDRAAAAAAGMDDFLEKPMMLEELRTIVARWCHPRPPHPEYVP